MVFRVKYYKNAHFQDNQLNLSHHVILYQICVHLKAICEVKNQISNVLTQ